MSTNYVCYSCGEREMSIFYELESVPAHSVLLMPTREVAMNYPKGNIVLGFCENCGFISNLTFDSSLNEYSSKYDGTQGFSPTFNSFARRLALSLIDRYDLHDKEIIEIGCGRGEFLALLCELGNNRGVGFDPTYISERDCNVEGRTTFIKDFYSEKYSEFQGDFIVCKMTLEHIQNTADFVSSIRRSIGDRCNTVVFFQVPDSTHILQELAFWDIYYEHCSYFTLGSLARLFRRCSFEVIDLWKDYDDQYLMIEARPGDGKCNSTLPQEYDNKKLASEVTHFAINYQHKMDRWKRNIQVYRKEGCRVVIWGSGSKSVAFLTTLDIYEEIKYVVDINPNKHGTYMAGTGQKIVGPGFLQEYKPDVVVVMNPIYQDEIRQDLNKMDISPELITP